MLTALTPPQLNTADSPAYCRYDDTARVITATLTATGTPGDTVYTSLRHRHTARMVHTIAHTLTSPTQTLTHTTDLETDADDADGIYRALSGDYAIVAQDTDPALAALPTIRTVSPTFPIVLVLPQTVRAQWLRGAQLRDETRLTATSTLPGLTIADMDARDMEPGDYAIVHDAAAHTLTWHHTPIGIDGPPVPYSPTATQTLTLWNGTRDQALDTTADGATLAAQPTGEYAVSLRYAPLADADIARHIQDATAALQLAIGRTGIEPRQHCTTLLAPQFPHADDRHFPPRPYSSDDMEGMIVPAIDVGVRRIIAVHAATGKLASQDVLTLPGTWTTGGNSLSSVLYLLPVATSVGYAYTQPAPVPAFGYPYSYGMARTIPAYWHFCLTAGLPDLWDALGQTIRAHIARDAAARTLLALSRTTLGALQSDAFSRDGISAQRAVTMGQGGVYGSEIAAHLDALEKERATIVRRVAGLRGSR